MSKIKILSNSEIQKIAAGEVVERPANVIKELIENSIDARANQITLYLEDAGKKLIRIIDNGSGMSQEDAKICIKHHATSKISTVNDLYEINTFGFRGEALSSIASISKIKLITKEDNAQVGIDLDIDQGQIIKESIAACNTGTDLTIYDLFFNVPARKKFLKTKETEWRNIVNIFQAFCLAHINIFFKLYHENKLIYNLPAITDINKRLSQLYDQEVSKNSVLINSKNNQINCEISGAITNSKYSRYDRTQIFMFVNKRWVKNYKLAQALIKGYQGMLQPEKYPTGVINILIDPKQVDINIHPRKEEVQFLHSRMVESLITTTVKNYLENNFNYNLGKINLEETKQEIKQEVKNANFFNLSNNLTKTENINSQENNKENKDFLNILNNYFSEAKEIKEPNKLNNLNKTEEQNIDSNFEIKKIYKASPIDYRLIGQTLKTYIIIETEQGLTLIDQHAAHERIIYEQLKEKFNTKSQIKLLFPQIIQLNPEDISTIKDYLYLFESIGINIEQISAKELVIKQTPIFLKNQPIDDIIKQVIGLIHENNQIEPEKLNLLIQEKINAQISCKAAIKAGDSLATEIINNLIIDLYNTENKLTCPHGRPTIFNIDKYEIEKSFKRNYKQKARV